MLLSPLLRVAGVGDGVFIILFFLAIALIITAFAVQSQRPTPYVIGAFILPTFLLVLFIAIPKRYPGEDLSRQDFDPGWSRRVGITTLFVIFTIISTLLIFIHKIIPKIRAYKIHRSR